MSRLPPWAQTTVVSALVIVEWVLIALVIFVVFAFVGSHTQPGCSIVNC
jgi:hypothetical protein